MRNFRANCSVMNSVRFSAHQVRALTGLARLGSRFDAVIDQMLRGEPGGQNDPIRMASIHEFQAKKLGRLRGLPGVVILAKPVEADALAAPPRRPAEPRRPGRPWPTHSA